MLKIKKRHLRHLASTNTFLQGKKASISIGMSCMLLAVLTLELCLLFLFSYRFTLYKMEEAMQLQAEYNLSTYDLQLKERYGLLALRNLPSTKVYESLLQAFPSPHFPWKDTEVKQNLEMNLGDSMEENLQLFQKELQYFTLTRLGVDFLSGLKQRMDFRIKKEKNQLKSSFEELKTVQETYQEVKESLAYEEEGEKEEKEERSLAKEAIISFLNELESRFAASIPEGIEPTHLASFFTRFFTHLNDIEQIYINFNKISIEHIILPTYILGQLSYHTRPLGKVVKQAAKEAESKLSEHEITYLPWESPYTYVGIERSKLQSQDLHEAEAILLQQAPDQAFLRSKIYIYVLRSLVQFIGLKHSVYAKIYQSVAYTISSLVFIVSLGQIWLPPSSIETLCLFVHSLVEAKKDLQNLLEGKTVALLPYQEEFPLSYSDYLFFFSFFTPKEKMALALVEHIQKDLSSPFFFSVHMEAVFEILNQRKIWIRDASYSSVFSKMKSSK